MEESKVNYNATYFLAKFKAIPDQEWTTGEYRRVIEGKVRHCALGHCFGLHCP